VDVGDGMCSKRKDVAIITTIRNKKKKKKRLKKTKMQEKNRLIECNKYHYNHKKY
jgi:hypothetical protein